LPLLVIGELLVLPLLHTAAYWGLALLPPGFDADAAHAPCSCICSAA